MKQALLIIDHGSRLDAANALLGDVAELLRKRSPALIVETAHMELAEPSIDQGLKACVDQGAQEIIAHPYMLAPGRHATQDIPAMVAAAAAQWPDVQVRVTEPLGLHEKMAEIILERAGLL